MRKRISTKPKVFTSSLTEEVSKKLDLYSIKNNLPKNKIIEEALLFYFRNIERKKFRESLKNYGRDPEFIDLAEEGMKDYADHLRKYPYESR